LNSSDAPFLLTVSDLFGIFKKHKRRLLRFFVLGTIIGLLFAHARPLVFLGKASFKEGATQSSSISLSQILSTSFLQKENGAQFLMRSESVLKKVVEKMGLQVHVKQHLQSGLLRNLFDNSLYSLSHVYLEPKNFEFCDVSFEGKKGKKMLLVLKGNQECYFFDENKELLGSGHVGEPLIGVDFSLTLKSLPKGVRLGVPYKITLSPWHEEVAILKESFEVRPDKVDRTILWLQVSHRDRQVAANLANQIAKSYLSYLVEEEEKLSTSQIAHLNDRRRKLESEFDEALALHMDIVKNSIDETGFVEVKQQLELVQKPLLTLHDRLVELKSWEGSLKEVQSAYAKTFGLPSFKPDELMVDIKESYAYFSSKQFAGVDLGTAKELHGNYQRQLDDIEGHIDRIQYLLPKIQEEGFELHSIGLLAKDDVAASLVSEASKLSLSLSQVGNYSQKDQERLSESLKSQKHFIEAHLLQTVELYEKQADVLQTKLASLRSVILDLIGKEKRGIQEEIHHYQAQLAKVPDKWRLEKILEAKSTMMKKVVEGVSQVIETKIAEHHLKTIGSKLIDPARAPNAPFRKNPLLVASVFGAISLLAAYVVLFALSLKKGLPLSLSAARGYGLALAGEFSEFCGCNLEELPARDLEVCRKIVQFTEEHQKLGQSTCIALSGLDAREISQNLAKLLSLQNKKILLADVSFQQLSQDEQMSGILPYLQEKKNDWAALAMTGYDFLPTGGRTRFATELFQTGRFDRFLETALQQYDRVILLSQTSLDASETICLSKKCDLCVTILNEESYDSLKDSGLLDQTKIIFARIK
jgi:hypothetical protein